MRTHCLLFCTLMAAAVLACPATSHAQQTLRSAPTATGPVKPAATAAPSKAEAELRAATTAYRAALDSGDIDAIAACWTADADFVDQMGRVYQVQAGLERAKRLAHEETHIAHLAPKTESLSIRFVTPDVAIEDGEFLRTGVKGGQSPTGLYTAVWVKREGKWLIDGLRESPVRTTSMTEPLKSLEWMIGDWASEGTERTAEISARWAGGKNSILVQMKLQNKGGEPVTGMQLIGWDPSQAKIRSFLFDSRGIFVEGTWTNEGDGWVVDATGAFPNGKRTLFTKLYSRIDDNTAIWESIDDTEGLPGGEARLKLIRKQSKK